MCNRKLGQNPSPANVLVGTLRSTPLSEQWGVLGIVLMQEKRPWLTGHWHSGCTLTNIFHAERIEKAALITEEVKSDK